MSTPPFRRPPGDPATILAAADSIGRAAGVVDTARSTFTAGTGTALRGWDTDIGTEFARLSGSASNRVAGAVTQVEGAAGLVKGFGDALLAAQDTIDALAAQWQAEQQRIEAVVGIDDPSAQQQSARSSAVSAQGRIEREAESALSDLRSVERRIAAQLDAGTDTLVAGSGAMSPEQLYNRVLTAWGDIAPTYREFKAGASAAGSLYRVVGVPARAVRAVRAYADANRAATLAAQTRNLALAEAAALMRGGTNRIPGQIGILARDIAAARRVADAASEVSAARHTNLYRSIVPASRFAKGLAVVGVVGGLYDLFWNPQGETGLRRGVSMGVDVVGVAAGTTGLLAAAGVIAPLGPVGLALVGGGLVVAGAWAAGTYIYDHWDDITHGVDVATDWVGERFTEAGETIEGAADAVGDLVGGIGDAVGGLFG